MWPGNEATPHHTPNLIPITNVSVHTYKSYMNSVSSQTPPEKRKVGVGVLSSVSCHMNRTYCIKNGVINFEFGSFLTAQECGLQKLEKTVKSLGSAETKLRGKFFLNTKNCVFCGLCLSTQIERVILVCSM